MGQPKSTRPTKCHASPVMKLTVLTLFFTAAIVGLVWSQDPNADNIEKKTRDRDDQSQTATDQSNDPADIKITADIRKMLTMALFL